RPRAVRARLVAALLAGALLGSTAWGAAEAIDFLKGLMPGAVSRAHEKEEPNCLKCHTVGQKHFYGKCLDCHEKVKQDVERKEGFHGAVDASACESCHSEHKGRAGGLISLDAQTFDHRKTDYPLTGKHQTVACADCHTQAKHREAPHDCLACHRTDDAHKGALGNECGRCHNPNRWTDISFDHAATKFPLDGKHRPLKCEACHAPGSSFAATPTACADCHRRDDPHKGILGARCESCHTARSWKESPFNHDRTDFKLTGGHKTVACLKCHTTPRLGETPKVCVTCHKRDDRHKGRLGAECARCHTAESWKRIGFDHSKTKYPLLGKHLAVPCAKCHAQERYTLPTDCAACHKRDDPHKGKLGAACEQCHVERGWKEVKTFNHQKTDFPLLGKHATVRCAQCHQTLLFTDAPSQCLDCHKQDDYHKGNFGGRCADCHTADNWKRITFDHAKDATFQLTGKHADVKCGKCHVTPLYVRKTPSQCIDCHKKDDDHKGNFGKQCGECHATDTWELKAFDHAKETGYALAGKHAGVACEQCHVRPLFTRKTSRLCVTCHQRDDPHAGELGARCEICHTEADFRTIKKLSQRPIGRVWAWAVDRWADRAAGP
ncbi:MAG: cytochrome C, partial [Nitrospirota bacterium]